MGHPPPSPASSMGKSTSLDRQPASVSGGDYTRRYFEHQHLVRPQQGQDLSAHRLACGYPNNDAHMSLMDKPDNFGSELYSVSKAHRSSFQHAHMTPPTPPPAEDGLRTCSGLNILRKPHDNNALPIMAPDIDGMKEQGAPQHPKRRSKRRSTKRGEPCMLDKPLSELAKEDAATSIIDIVAFVHRSTSVRQREQPQTSSEGKIKRPLNAFLLYRKAFGPFAKQQLQKILNLKEEPKDQQLVSRLCGQSWLMETASIKSKFKGFLAETEKSKHIQAFPGYKYTPKTGKKQKEDDMGSTKRGFGINGARPSSSSNTALGHGSATPSFPFSELDHFGYTGRFETQSLVDAGSQAYWPSASSVSHAPAGALYGHNGYGADFYQQRPDLYAMPSDLLYGEGAGPVVAAGSYVPQSYPNAHLTLNTSLGGTSGPASSDLCIDPSLLPGAGDAAFEWPSKSQVLGSSWKQLQGDRSTMFPSMTDLDADGAHNAYLMGAPDDWQVEPLDDMSHFNDWMAHDDTLGGV
ncbi:hypothetical protein CDD82_3494 [Ophiocordyceps australis]|uniref:HMG box domain-containing protein n=1 Tax=Ophiocordyceps australis TaxID=1399860 RepID=A0A2C5ZCL6_9HYPO|nr:hypothetical protein CDD82_3494 [Ophiocordyceps australis]